MSNQLHNSISEYISGRFYGQRVIGNAWRATYAECLVYSALHAEAPETDWRPSGESDPWDLENGQGVHLRVKHTAALQSPEKSKGTGKPHAMSFDIHPGKRGRQTHIYVFAWHPESDPEIADQRDAGQWLFCVMPEDELPEPEIGQKTQHISLIRLTQLAERVGAQTIGYDRLASTINFVAEVIRKADLEDARLANEVMDRIRRGEEKVYTAQEVRAHLGLDC